MVTSGKMGLSVGIDLGTTNTVVGVVRGGVAATVADPQGHRLIPSVVSFPASGPVLVGRDAQEKRLNDPANTVYSVKPVSYTHLTLPTKA